MASLTPRASRFWADPTTARMSYYDAEEDVEQVGEADGDEFEYDGRTPLDKTIDRIGMGSYQWTLLSLCGFGWMADNMWIQAIAIILPRVQQHYSVPDNYIGTLSSSMFAGMMFGAVGWGTCSDLMGRIMAFNATLFFTALFGILASFAPSFSALCILLFLLGSAVGGSMPTDGTLLLEHMPKGKQYLVTALSVFFSFGSVLSAVVALLVIPRKSCTQNQTCNPATDNQGWQYMLIYLGLITLSMFLARILFFRLYESPRYLVHAGRHQEALESLQLISRFNGSEIPIDLEDVDDHRPSPEGSQTGERGSFLPSSTQETSRGSDGPLLGALTNGEAARDGVVHGEPQREDGVKDYSSTDESPTSLENHSFITPVDDVPPRGQSLARGDVISSVHTDPTDFKDPITVPQPRYRSRRASQSNRSSVISVEIQKHFRGLLPRWISRPLLAWLDRIGMVLGPEWFRTTMLVWTVWFFMSLAYTMFNVYFPKLLETGSSINEELPKPLEDSLWDVVIFTLGGCPGAILGAYMVETPLGRRGSLAGTTFMTAFFSIVFVHVKSPFMVRISSVGISLSATTMYAVLYGWTPEIFGTKVRGTACGIASALSRIGGMIAPLLGGALLVVNRAVPVYASVAVYLTTGICVLLLHETAGQGGGGTLMH